MLSGRRRAAWRGRLEGLPFLRAIIFKADKETTMKKLWNIFTSALVVLAVLLALLLVGARLVGLQVFTVLSGSMEPTYHTGSLIYVKKVDATKLSEGTVITFMLDEDTIATHRIVGVVPDEQDPSVVRYRTKGDANESEDGGLVHYKNVVGTPVFTIPRLGYLANYIQHPPGTYVAISAGALILLLMFLPELLGMLTGDEKKEQAPEEDKPRKPSRAKKQRSAPLAPPLGELPSAHTGLRGPSPGAYENRENEMKRVSSDAEAPLPPQNRLKAQRSGFETERQKEGAESSFPGSYANRGNGKKRVSSAAGSHAAASTAKSPKRKGGAHCAK